MQRAVTLYECTWFMTVANSVKRGDIELPSGIFVL